MQRLEPRRGRSARDIRSGFAEHLKYTLGVDRHTATDHDRYMALAYAVRDRLIDQWMRTQRTHHQKHVKRVYYLSLEFLMGRAMGNNVINLGVQREVRAALDDLGYEWEELREQEVDAGLGNGGLGRLAACFLDSLATLDLPAFGYGLRYDYGSFRQGIENGYQIEHPDDWLRRGNPWEIERPDVAYPVRFGGHVHVGQEGGKTVYTWTGGQRIVGVAYDTPIVGYGGATVNTLRLWSAKSTREFDLAGFNEGEYVEAVGDKVDAENLTKVLYPNDKLYLGKELRFKQQYLFVACSLADILRRFRKSGKSWSRLPSMAAIQLNDTHPALAVAELMRLLVDDQRLGWDEAWEISVRTLGYTNHTLMPEALETWSVAMFEKLLPRHLQIIYQINHEFLQRVAARYPGDHDKLARMSIIEEGDPKRVRMAYLSIVGSHSTNGVAALHTELLKRRLVPEFAEVFPERFTNKTNGITQRRFLLKANPPLADLITEAIGAAWITDFGQLANLAPLAEDPAFRARFREVKLTAKQRLCATVLGETGWELDTATMFDVQIKRIHEYKRQLLNALHIVMRYDRIRGGDRDVVPRTVLIAGKAAPGYRMAKLIIKLINNIGAVINADPAVRGLLQVYFLPNYRVSLAERIIPAADVSEQISTAGTEASGTGNMKFMANGALTVGTLDGANIEIAAEAGRENCFIFGLTADQVEELRRDYTPWDYYHRDAEIKAAFDLLFRGHFDLGEPGVFDPILGSLFDQGDHYMHLADLRGYANAQREVDAVYADPEQWSRRAIINIAGAGTFSTDRTIDQYAKEIWGVEPCRVASSDDATDAIDEAKRPR